MWLLIKKKFNDKNNMKNLQNTNSFVSNILFRVHSFDLIVLPFSHAVMSDAYTWLIYDKSDVCNSHFPRTFGLYM